MRFGEGTDVELDDTDRNLLALLQEDCRTPLARLGERVGLSAPAVLERIKKLEAAGVIMGYHAALDARALGVDVTAFIGVITSTPDVIEHFEQHVMELDEVLECHHVTGEYTLLLKVKTANTKTLERLISELRSQDGVTRTETIVVLSTFAERLQVAVHPRPRPEKRPRRGGDRNGQLRKTREAS